MAKVDRIVLYKGATYWLRYAMREDESMPAKIALDAIRQGVWDEDPEAVEEGLPSDAQISSFFRLLARMKYFADEGEPERGGHVNALREGIWEFKEGAKRVSFFDTDGSGYCEPKHKFRYPMDADYPGSDFWWVPQFDQDVRLGHCFGKPWGQAKTEEEDIHMTITVREEDLNHDIRR